MAYWHIDELIKKLTEAYIKTQSLYDKASEEFSNNIVSSEVYSVFNEKKKNLDMQLTRLSTALSAAKQSNLFIKIRNKNIREVEIFEKALEAFIEEDKPNLIANMESMFKNSINNLELLDSIKIFLDWPKSKKKHRKIIRDDCKRMGFSFEEAKNLWKSSLNEIYLDYLIEDLQQFITEEFDE